MSSNIRVTAKVICQTKTTPGGAGEGSTTLSFAPDYADGRNAEWAKYTPALSLTMTVNGDVSDTFEQGGKYTLTFEHEVPSGEETRAAELDQHGVEHA